jgi:hypothetical protein
MKLWELIKKGAEEGLEVLKDGVTVVGKTSRILKKKVELTSVQGEVRKLFTRLGSLAYEFHSKNEQDFYRDEGVKGLMAQIEGHRSRVREIETEIETINKEERRKTSEKTGEGHEEYPMI